MANGSLSHFFEKDMNNIVLSRISYNDLVFGIPEDKSYQGNAIIDKILEKTNSDDVKTCISIIKGEIPLDMWRRYIIGNSLFLWNMTKE